MCRGFFLAAAASSFYLKAAVIKCGVLTCGHFCIVGLMGTFLKSGVAPIDFQYMVAPLARKIMRP
jgi:hypothetical protein